jgi:hypothetical protein
MGPILKGHFIYCLTEAKNGLYLDNICKFCFSLLESKELRLISRSGGSPVFEVTGPRFGRSVVQTPTGTNKVMSLPKSRPDLGPTRPPAEWVPRYLCSGKT